MNILRTSYFSKQNDTKVSRARTRHKDLEFHDRRDAYAVLIGRPVSNADTELEQIFERRLKNSVELLLEFAATAELEV